MSINHFGNFISYFSNFSQIAFTLKKTGEVDQVLKVLNCNFSFGKTVEAEKWLGEPQVRLTEIFFVKENRKRCQRLMIAVY